MKQLQELIAKINADKCAAMTVWDLNDPDPKTRVLISNASKHKIEQIYKSFENFLETIYKNGVTSIRVFERRANGSTYIPFGEPFDYDFVKKETSPVAPAPAPEAKTIPTAPDQMPMPGNALAAPGLAMGLNAVQMYHAQDYPRLHGEFSSLKSENERLKEQVLELKEAALENKYATTKSDAQKELLGSLAGHAPAILSALGSLGLKIGGGQTVQAAASGLASEQLTPTQTHVFQVLRQLDDETLAAIGAMSERLNDEEFGKELSELLVKHNVMTPQ